MEIKIKKIILLIKKRCSTEEFIKRFSEKGDTVFDPFMGTGSTGIATLNLDRKFIGYEMDTENNRFNVAKHRIENEVKKK